MTQLPTGGLVLYKRRPACVKESLDGRLQIETDDGGRQRVRPKDVVLLHAGPCSLRELQAPPLLEDVDGVRELLFEEAAGDGTFDLATLTELLYGEATPAAVWSSWLLVAEGLHFEGPPDAVRARSAQAVEDDLRQRQQRAAEAEAWTAFVERVRAGAFEPEDDVFLREVEDLASARREGSHLLKELGRAETPESAHALLLALGRWSVGDVPYPARAGLSTTAAVAPLADMPASQRADLTHLAAFAVDDEGNRDPDDAVSIDADGALWVHVADVAALVPPDSPADIEARARGATLYLPDGPASMLPTGIVDQLGLGLRADGIGPALSFRLELDEAGCLTACAAMPSTVRVQRLTYAQAEPLLEQDHDLARIAQLVDLAHRRRLAAGALELSWPEVRVRVDRQGDEPRIEIIPLAPLRSRDVVAGCMILAGEGVARHALDTGLPLPFSIQEAGAEAEDDGAVRTGAAAAFALRRRQRPARVSGSAGPHRGLGLEAYARTTSPLRRYLDLLVHQQLRAVAEGQAPMEETTLMARAAEAESVAGSTRVTERQCNRHWILAWLREQKNWHGRAELIDTRGRRGLVLLPDLALESPVSLPPGGVPGAVYEATVRGVDLPRLDLHLELTPRD